MLCCIYVLVIKVYYCINRLLRLFFCFLFLYTYMADSTITLSFPISAVSCMSQMWHLSAVPILRLAFQRVWVRISRYQNQPTQQKPTTPQTN